jgi:glycosyltransferase involved in cell wall biosynthesis
MNSYLLSRRFARDEGFSVEMVFVLDRADPKTKAIVISHPLLDGSEKFVEVDHGDLALARNSGVFASSGEYICTLDGDDLISRRYFCCHLIEAERNDLRTVLHPEMVVSFGMYNAFNWQVDQAGEYFDADSLLTVNPWISAAFSHRSIFEEIPYRACYPRATGFGFEDWYWNCETIARGLVHRLAWGAVYVYRRKYHGSLNEVSHGLHSVMPPTALFQYGSLWAARGE